MTYAQVIDGRFIAGREERNLIAARYEYNAASWSLYNARRQGKADVFALPRLLAALDRLAEAQANLALHLASATRPEAISDGDTVICSVQLFEGMRKRAAEYGAFVEYNRERKQGRLPWRFKNFGG